MPRHDIICDTCGHRCEINLPVGATPNREPCPECKSTETHKAWDERSARFACIGPGWSGRTMKNKKEREAKSKALAKSQWENVDPGNTAGTPRNPTPGGIFDRGNSVG